MNDVVVMEDDWDAVRGHLKLGWLKVCIDAAVLPETRVDGRRVKRSPMSSACTCRLMLLACPQVSERGLSGSSTTTRSSAIKELATHIVCQHCLDRRACSYICT
jgi:hypothetical protein